MATLPPNYTGLSYESAQLADPDFFSAANERLVAFVRGLGRQGVLRIGGNTSEFTVWSPEGFAPSGSTGGAVGPDTGGLKPRPKTPVTPKAIRNLASFLQATGWQLIYGLNLGNGSPEQAAGEAKAVNDAAGDRVIAFQIGNEPDLYHRNGLRSPEWRFSDYYSEWKKYAQAIRSAAPKARLAGPDVANSTDWIVSFAEQAKGEIVELTGHYYAEGPPTNPAMNIERLLHANPKLLQNIPVIMNASRQSGHPFRMAEGNSCYNGGKPGVSDTFASALWGADYMLQVGQAGYAGVNFHGGGNGYYTPIAGTRKSGFSARPLYYGMLVANQFAGATMLDSTLGDTSANVTAYAARTDSELRVAIFNKDEGRAVRVVVISELHGASARLWRLEAPGLETKAGVTLAGAAVSSNGSWSPAHEETVQGNGGRYEIDLRPASAAVAFVSL
ncbi:MAG: hypothetical protein JOZ62_12700 [Acidobacteriaceae bacterium]|nr:hypothetical protein [Acidobacteriaceae bacterium]